MVVVGMVAFIGVAGVAIDLGHAFYAREQLQNSSNAAALAGAAALPNTTAATTAVTAYSALPGDHGATSALTNVSLGSTPTYQCLTTLTTNEGLGCATATGTPSGAYNAVKVTQTAKVPLWFGGMFGVPAFNISATATAAMAGGPMVPYNVAVILDTTSSMTATDSGLQCSGTQESCALQGVQTMLGLMYPCASGTTCTSSSTPVDSVSLFVFPAVTSGTTTTGNGTNANDYTCGASVPVPSPYTFQNVTTGTLANGLLNLPSTLTYQITPFSHDYRTTDATTTLNPSSLTTIAAGGKSGCTGIQAKGGEGTYYAQVIYAAQAALIAQQAANPGTQNAMIILGDGNMNASGSSGEIKATTGTLNGTGSGSNKNSYAYPSAVGQCGQAILATAAAAVTPNANGANGTRVYTVGYGAPTSGCTTDATYSAYKGISPCTTLQDMASSPGYFYSDDGDGCKSPNQLNFTNLKQIFTAITRTFSTPRLVPNGTT
jgi:Flp pilus assembly protein TadG